MVINMKIAADSDLIRYTGRWGFETDGAVTTAPGGMIELMFEGSSCVLLFDTTMNMQPFPHLWIRVDNGARIETVSERVIRLETEESGRHCVEIIYKGGVEIQHRWYPPLIGKIKFLGAEAEAFLMMPEDRREVIEFIGDSITEGVLIDADRRFDEFDQFNRPYQDDCTATYAWLTAQKLGMKPVIFGYGAVGVTKGGCGSVPKAAEAYPYNFFGNEAKNNHPRMIVINYGANDKGASAEKYVQEYKSFLELVRAKNPNAAIVVLSAFYGVYPDELKAMVESYNKENNDGIHFIDSAGWVPREPLHPLRDGHKKISERLYPELKKLLY